MTKATAKPLVDSVLKYFAGFIQFAQLRNDLQSVWHWQDCWCLMFQAFFGSYKVTVAHKPTLVPSTVVSTPLVRPPWFVKKYSRPARKVIGRMAARARSGSDRECFSTDYDVLECGHKLPSQYREPGAPPARWRYCGLCPPKNQQMREAGMTGSVQGSVTAIQRPAFAVATAANPISGRGRVSRRAA